MAFADLEVWLIGTPTQVDAALTALRDTGRLIGASKPQTLYGADAGRVRRYLRVSVATEARADVARGRGRAAA